MATKTARLEMRTDLETRERIARAAELLNEPVSSFVLSAAAAAADRVLARSDATLMDPEQFDELIESLDVPDDAPRLAALAQRPRRFRRS
ncbi:DUF1778 domain-containing protein [Nocardiopsis sp. NPDC050513]|uniref:DUF1778 domain-containing protein n=1 Tax=Nocardiopsis sp. NPDC050513 TaxID=3364338 RepID=UPI0037B97A90